MKIKEVIIVEGKYDKIKISQLFDTVIIKTDGFAIYKDKKTVDLIKKLADSRGVIILTDSDNSGLMIRNYLKNVLKDSNVKHAFVPTVKGKEKRKAIPSKQGLLGVEGIENEMIINAVLSCARLDDDNEFMSSKNNDNILRLDLYKMGLLGGENSAYLRKKLLNYLSLPENMSTSMFLDVLNTLYNKESIKEILLKLKK